MMLNETELFSNFSDYKIPICPGIPQVLEYLEAQGFLNRNNVKFTQVFDQREECDQFVVMTIENPKPHEFCTVFYKFFTGTEYEWEIEETTLWNVTLAEIPVKMFDK